MNLEGAVPSVFQVLNVTRSTLAPVIFTVPFTAVDGGEDLRWLLWANWGLEGINREGWGEVARPGNLGMGGAGPTERAARVVWTPSAGLRPGCNQLTLFITYADNVTFDTLKPEDLSQAAIVTYWVNVDAPLGEGQTLPDCPTALVVPP